jgi:hypothetical protein
MPFTREQGRAALTYVIVTVMNQPEDGPMAKSLTTAQIDNVEDLGTLLEADIENLSFITLIDADDPTPMHGTRPTRSLTGLHCLHQALY